jgi:hypothetical protein
LNLLNDRRAQAEPYRLGIHTEFGTALIMLNMPVNCHAGDREARQRQRDKDRYVASSCLCGFHLLRPSMSDKRLRANFQFFPL